MMLVGAEAIAAWAQPPGKGGNIVSLKNWDEYLMHTFCEPWSFATKNVGFEHGVFSYWQCLLKKMYLCNKAWSTIRHTFTKQNKNSRTKRGAGAPWAHL